MAVAQHLSVGQLAAGIDAGVVFPVADHVVVAAHQRGDDAHVGLEARAEGDDARLAQEFGQRVLQLQVHLQCAVEEARAGAARAILLQRLDAGLYHHRVGGQTQIVVGAQHDAALALHDDLHVLPGLQRMEVGIYALFLQLRGQGRRIALLKNVHKSPLYLIYYIRYTCIF